MATGAKAAAGLGDIQEGHNLQEGLPLKGAALRATDIVRQEGLPYLQDGTSSL